MSNDIFFIHAGSALHSWLNYISSVKRIYVLAENSIKYPISEYIGTMIDPSRIHLDKLHPNLNDRYLDLRFFDEINSQETEIAIEFKYARLGYTDQKAEKKRIFNDIMRLKLFVEQAENRKGYFLICGPQIDFIKAFQSIGWSETDRKSSGLPTPKNISTNYDKVNPAGFYTNWFEFKKDKTQEIDLGTKTDEIKEIYKDFFEEYKNAFKVNVSETTLRVKNPITRLVYLSESLNLKDIPTPMKVGIWEVTAKK
jgi:hypothetical protein